MAPPRVIFARHGESTANLTRTFANGSWSHPLTETGVRQALELAQRLGSESVSEIRHSPLLRASQTAEILARTLGVAATVEEALTEFDVGRWEGTDSADGWAEYNQVTARWVAGDRAASVGGGESLAGVIRRTEPLFRKLVEDVRQGETVVCIGHGGTYRAALPVRLTNVTHTFAFAQPFPNTGWVVAEVRDGSLVCTEWCGVIPPSTD